MLSNMLRMLLSRIMFRAAVTEKAKMESRLNIEEERKKEEIIGTINSLEDAEALNKRLQSREKYCTQPAMAETQALNIMFFIKLYRMIAIVMSIGIIGMILYSMNEKKYIVLGVSILIFVWILAFLMIFLQRYNEKTKCLYYQDKICIKRYLRKDKEITYEEVKECIEKRKIKVHNGRFELPYNSGKIFVYTWGKPMSGKFYKFINQKCGIRIPEITKYENDVVRKTGIGWTLYTYMALPLFGLGLFGAVVCTVGDFGINHDAMEIIDYFLQYTFSLRNIFGVMGGICVLAGVLLKVCFYFPAKKHFKIHKDLIKVSLF